MGMNNQHRIATVAIAIIVAIFAIAATPDEWVCPPGWTCTQDDVWDVEVVSVIDGDTVKVDLGRVYVGGRRVEQWEVVNIRIDGIDAPETSAGKTDPERDFKKQCGATSKERATEFLVGDVELISDLDKDKYGRLLGDLRVDGRLLSEFMLDERLAVEYDGSKRTFENHRENCEYQAESTS